MSISQTFGSKYRTPLHTDYSEWRYSLTNGLTYPNLFLDDGVPALFYPENAGSFTLEKGVYIVSIAIGIAQPSLSTYRLNYICFENLPSKGAFTLASSINYFDQNNAGTSSSFTYVVTENDTLFRPYLCMYGATGTVAYRAEGSSIRFFKIL